MAGHTTGPHRLGLALGIPSWAEGSPGREGGHEGAFAVSFLKSKRYQLSGWEEADGSWNDRTLKLLTCTPAGLFISWI
jgi:hypothetical protein